MRLLVSHLILCCCVAFLAACESADREIIEVNPQPLSMPDWVRSGYHPLYNPANGYVFVMLSSGEREPERFVLLQALYQQVHGSIQATLDRKLAEPLKSASRLGRWVGRQHVPDHAVIYDGWSDGFASAGFAAIKREELEKHNSAAIADGPKSISQPFRVPKNFDVALEDLRWRADLVAQYLNELTSFVLAGVELEDAWLEHTHAVALNLTGFYDDLRANLHGGDLSLALGVRHHKAIELELIYRGEPATDLPLTSLDAGQQVEASRQTDRRGRATLTFEEPIRFTGRSENLVGFALDPDLLMPTVESGLEVEAWTTTLRLPTRDNVVVYMNLIEKYERGSFIGPVNQALREILHEAGIPILEKRPDKLEKRFVLTIEGVLNCHKLESNRGDSLRQVRAKGAIILKSHPVPALASVSFTGIADIVKDDQEAAINAALKDGWALVEKDLKAKFREAFPPLFPIGSSVDPSRENSPQ